MHSFISSSLAMAQWNRCANVSSAHSPALSLCVVMTSRAPRIAAISEVKLLAPPICPESTEMVFIPRLSTQTTAGSSCLSLMNGAMVRTQMPIAPMKMKASKFFHCLPTSLRAMILALNSRCRSWAISFPASLMGMIAIFCILISLWGDVHR